MAAPKHQGAKITPISRGAAGAGPKKAPAAPPKPRPKTRRVTLELDPDLVEQLEALAAEQRRELKPQMIYLLETAVKAAAGQREAKARRRRRKDLYGF
jgi:hypothetical protein